jgi:hypothetical protein
LMFRVDTFVFSVARPVVVIRLSADPDTLTVPVPLVMLPAAVCSVKPPSAVKATAAATVIVLAVEFSVTAAEAGNVELADTLMAPPVLAIIDVGAPPMVKALPPAVNVLPVVITRAVVPGWILSVPLVATVVTPAALVVIAAAVFVCRAKPALAVTVIPLVRVIVLAVEFNTTAAVAGKVEFAVTVIAPLVTAFIDVGEPARFKPAAALTESAVPELKAIGRDPG